MARDRGQPPADVNCRPSARGRFIAWQANATGTIARGAEEAAGGSRQVLQEATHVDAALLEARAAGAQLLSGTGALAEVASRLTAEIAAFLAEVKAG